MLEDDFNRCEWERISGRHPQRQLHPTLCKSIWTVSRVPLSDLFPSAVFAWGFSAKSEIKTDI